MRSFRRGDMGAAVADIQVRLVSFGARIDPSELGGAYGASTEEAVREFQARRHLSVDGLVGPDTWGQLVEAGYELGDRTVYLRSPIFRGDDVRALQRRLNALGFDAGKEDGLFGPRTDQAVREFQRNVAQPPDGLVGPATVTALERLRPTLSGPSRAVVREEESLRHIGSGLAGKVVAIDPGAEALEAPAAEEDLAVAGVLADGLASAGAKTAFLRLSDEAAAPSERARRANEIDAAACVSLHILERRAAGEPSCFYFGSESTHSPAGSRLAELVSEELARAGLAAGTGRRTGALLRETRMPAILVEAAGSGESFIKAAGKAIAAGLGRFFEG